FLEVLAHSAEGFPAPVPGFGDSFRDELRCRLALARARLFHVLILVSCPESPGHNSLSHTVWARRPTTAQVLAFRARVILACCGDGLPLGERFSRPWGRQRRHSGGLRVVGL